MTSQQPAATLLRDLLRDLRPRACAYLGPTPQGVGLDTEEDLWLRWRMLRAQLAEQGADRPTLNALDEHVGKLSGTPLAWAGYALVASGGVIHLAQPMSQVVSADRARFGAPADVMPLLAWWQRRPAFVSVLIDRVGAEVTATPAASLGGLTRTINGPDDEIERNAPGGWAQGRYQRRAEDSWHHNAVAVADAAVRALDEVKAELLLVAGDVRAVQLLRDYLDKHVRRDLHLRMLPGGRSPDGSSAAHQRAVAQAVAEHADAQTAGLLDLFRQRSGLGGEAVEGLGATLAALAEGRLDTLFVADDPFDERRAWFGPDVLCAELAETQPDSPLSGGRMIDVAVRAALLTDADVHVVTAAAAKQLDDQVGGLCRFRLAEPSA